MVAGARFVPGKSLWAPSSKQQRTQTRGEVRTPPFNIVFLTPVFFLSLFSLSLSFFRAFPGRWRLQTIPNVRPRCRRRVIGRGIRSGRRHLRVEVCMAVISQVRPGKLAAWGRCLERAPPGLCHSPFYPTCAYFPCLCLRKSPGISVAGEEGQVSSMYAHWDSKQIV